jgi:hypothetical protein
MNFATITAKVESITPVGDPIRATFSCQEMKSEPVFSRVATAIDNIGSLTLIMMTAFMADWHDQDNRPYRFTGFWKDDKLFAILAELAR